MKLSYGIVLAAQFLTVLALPSPNKGKSASSTTSSAAAAVTTTTPAAGAEEEEKANEVNLTGHFGVKVNIGGGNIKTDTLFPPGQNGALEVEIQDTQARVLTVTENKTPAAAPAGFTALESVSYVVAMEGGAANLTLQKIDYIRNANSTLDISKGVLGRLCTETKTFVVGAGVGETEFEADENELTTPVDNIVGEFAMFLPDAAAATGGAAAAEGATTGGSSATTAEVLAQLLGLLGVGTAGGN
ncbi:hypothetical protein CONLIGDRAFT_675652 [Coniochaeta ligniaria NRRL 30616]|uniref:Cell wall protein n=1 Tax=Coniochaeta ligniaria NRRL 30616 TaxID=1408157 RepID=A0A1J7J3M5_9PEZI|nr:hypothetical protein CONLIGDRAFT_675652 [Coniochaeta ligniaria NRRL 30616]